MVIEATGLGNLRGSFSAEGRLEGERTSPEGKATGRFVLSPCGAGSEEDETGQVNGWRCPRGHELLERKTQKADPRICDSCDSKLRVNAPFSSSRPVSSSSPLTTSMQPTRSHHTSCLFFSAALCPGGLAGVAVRRRWGRGEKQGACL